MVAPSEGVPTQPMMSAQTIQDIVNAISIIPTYVRELERRNSSLQRKIEIMATRLLQLEKQYVQIIRGNVVISESVSSHMVFSEIRNSRDPDDGLFGD
jgi:ATP-dependent RNA circularization protein (DNA/RNA ligase family)